MKKIRIDSLQGLRWLMCLLIFFYHACEAFVKETWVFTTFLQGAGCMPVSVFFVISGFVSGLSNKKRISTKKEYLSYMKDKAKKFYPIHWFFLLMMIPFRYSFYWKGVEAVFYTILNALLLHSWVPNEVSWMSLNGVTWYLSTTMFLYAITPLLQLLNSKIEQRKKKEKIYWFFIGCCVVVCFMLPIFVRTNVRYWLYAFPPVRVLDYAAGFFLGKIFKDKAETESQYQSTVKNQVLYSLKESVAFAMILVFLVAYPYLDVAFRRSAVQLPICIFTVYTIAQNRGVLSKGLACPMMVKGGNVSLYYMMCHLSTISFCAVGIWYDFLEQWLWVRWCMVFVSLGLIAVSKPIYDYIINFIEKIFTNRNKQNDKGVREKICV